ncbi:MAG: Uma2 family endonuclease [Candidatus Eremiobacteraeota bacterium]|nr:Uma2 family endonuclease [Candidatus Eremiobacteraeota bacterium]
MTTAVGTERITAADFLHHPAANGPLELVHGEIRVLAPAGGRHGGIAANVFRALDRHVEPRALGHCFVDGTGFALPPHDDVVRSPDAAFVRAGRLPADTLPEGWVPIAPDFVVEVLSPSESHSDVMEKLDDYFAGGTTLAWVVDSRRRGVEVHAAGEPVRWMPWEATLDGAPVLPELRVAVAELFKGVLSQP